MKPVMISAFVKSIKNAPTIGMTIPEFMRKKMHNARDKGADVGIETAISFLSEAKSMVAAVYLLPAFKKYDIVPKIVEGIGMLEED
jgi:hypothetical protein